MRGFFSRWSKRVYPAESISDPILAEKRAKEAADVRVKKINDLFASGVAKCNHSDNAGAVQDFNAVLALNPKHAESLTMRGAVQVRLGLVTEALSDLDASLRIVPDNAWALKQRGAVKLMLKNFADALADFDAALKIKPSDEWVIAQRAEVQRQQLAAEKARVKKINELFVSGVAKYQCDDDAGAIQDFNAVLALDANHVESLTMRGAVQVRLGLVTEALSDLDASLRIVPDNAWALAQRGEVKQGLKDYVGALRDFDASLAIEPSDEWVIAQRAKTQRLLMEAERALEVAKKINDLFVLGVEKYQRDDNAGAIQDFNAVLVLDANHVESLKMRGAAQLSLGCLREALSDLDLSLSIVADDTWALAQRGAVKQGLKDYVGALEDFDASLAIEPADEWAIDQRAKARRQFADEQRRIAEEKRAKKVAKARMKEINNLFTFGIESYNRGGNVMAIQYFTRILALDPKHAESLKMRGAAQLSLGCLREALSDLDASLRIKPGNAWALSKRGEVKRGLKNYAGALADFNAALNITLSGKLTIPQHAKTQRLLMETERAVEVAKKIKELARSGVHKYACGDNIGATQDFNDVLRLDPEHAESLKMRRVIQQQLAEANARKAAAEQRAAEAKRAAEAESARKAAEQRAIEVKRAAEAESARKAAEQSALFAKRAAEIAAREKSSAGSSAFFSSASAPAKKQGVFFESNSSYCTGGFTITLYRDGSFVDSVWFVNKKTSEWSSPDSYHADVFRGEICRLSADNYPRAAEYFYEAKARISTLQRDVNRALTYAQDEVAAAAAKAAATAAADAAREEAEKEEERARIEQEISSLEYQKQNYCGDTSWIDAAIGDLQQAKRSIGESRSGCCVM